MMRLTLVINGVDFSTAANRTGYSIEYEARTGNNAVMMLNGDEYPDIIDTRPVISWPLNSLWSDELAALYSAIGDGQYVLVSYFDTKQNTVTNGAFVASISSQRAGIINARGTMFTGMTLVLRAR